MFSFFRGRPAFFLSLLFLSFFHLDCSSSSAPSPARGGTEDSGASSSACSTGALAAFPGAEGFGACASGGRGGQVLHVTTLAADPNGEIPGSFQWALNQPGPRYILFKVSGTIQGTPILQRGEVTIAGQTSPQGILLRGFDIQGDSVCEDDGCPVPTLYPQNFIVRHLRSRVAGGPEGAFIDEDALRLHHAVNGIIDHFSAENALDEAIQISFSRDITIQNTLLAETVGDHYQYGGMLIQYSDPNRGFPLTRLSIHHNHWNRLVGRLPQISRENPSANQSILEIELSNNLIWDPGFYIDPALHQVADPSALLYFHMNVVGNYIYGRAFNPDGLGDYTFGLMNSEFLQDLPDGHPTTTYFSDNGVNLYPLRKDYQLLYRNNDYASTLSDLAALPYPDPASPPAFARASRHDFPAITYTPLSQLIDYMRAQVGAFPRDAMDHRLMGFVDFLSFDATPRNANVRGDAFGIADSASGAPADGDGDGMPDEWEAAHGQDPARANPNGFELSSNPANGILGCSAGYTNLECYLNELALMRVEGS